MGSNTIYNNIDNIDWKQVNGFQEQSRLRILSYIYHSPVPSVFVAKFFPTVVHSISLPSYYHPGMTEMLLKGELNSSGHFWWL